MSVDGPGRLDEPLDRAIERVMNDWRPLLDRWRASTEGAELVSYVDARRAAGATVYPKDVFRALRLTTLARTRVVILGQDPYHGPGQAEGLAFSVPAGTRAPPSLRNILKEAAPTTGSPLAFEHGHLGAWAERGVLLLNTCLTVEQGRPASHARRGWEALTDAVVAATAREERPKVFMLWGAHAQAKEALVEAASGGRHLVLQCNHPSPLSAARGDRPFAGCGHFARARDFLEGGFDWSLPARRTSRSLARGPDR